MLQFLLDTDHLTLFHHGHAAVGAKMAAQPAGAVGLAIVTVEEALRGRLGTLYQAQTGPQRITRYSQLQETVELVNQFPIVRFDQTAESHFQQLWSLRLRVGTQDLKMAAVARANRLTLLTQPPRFRPHSGPGAGRLVCVNTAGKRLDFKPSAISQSGATAG